MSLDLLYTFTSAGGTAPTLAGWVNGSLTAAAGTLTIAAANPFGAMGTGTYSPGFTIGTTNRLKVVIWQNTDATNSVTLTQAASNGLVGVFDAASHGIIVPATGTFIWYSQTGTATLTTGTNDGVTVAVGGGSPVCKVTFYYGP